MGFFMNKQNQPMQKPMKEKMASSGCKIKVRRDSNGRVVGYEDNGQCSSGQIKAFTENIDFEGSESEEE